VKPLDIGSRSIGHLLETDHPLQYECVVLVGDDAVLAEQQHSRNPTKKTKKLKKTIMLKETKNLMKAKKLEHIAKISQVLQLVEQTTL